MFSSHAVQDTSASGGGEPNLLTQLNVIQENATALIFQEELLPTLKRFRWFRTSPALYNPIQHGNDDMALCSV